MKALKRWWVLAAAVTVAVVVALVAVLVSSGDTDQTIVTAPTSTPQPEWSTPHGDQKQGDVDASGRPILIPVNPAGDLLPQTAKPSSGQIATPIPTPPGLEWQLVWGVPLPFSTGDGPREITDGVPSGFSQTPQGATIAALQIQARMSFGPRADAMRVVELATEGSPGRKAVFEAIAGYGGSEAATDNGTVPAAIRIAPGNWTTEAATVEVAYGPNQEHDSTDTGVSYRVTAISVVWRNGWKLKLPDTSATATAERSWLVESIEGWTVWE